MVIKNILLQLFCLIIAGAISVFAFSPVNFVPAILITILILLFILENYPPKSRLLAFFFGYVFGIGYFNSQLYWSFYSLYEVIDTGLVVALLGQILFTAYLSLFIGMVTLVYQLIKTKHVMFNNIFLFPTIWVTFELLRSYLFTGFSWGEIGYTQVNTELLKGWYPLFGNYFVSWLTLSLCGSIFTILGLLYKIIKINDHIKLYGKFNLRLNNFSIKINLVYILSILALGGLFLRISYTTEYGRPIKVALLQGNIDHKSKWTNDDLIDNLNIYANLVARANANLIVIPETAISQFEQYLPNGYIDNLVKLSKQNNAELIAGMPKIINQNYDYVNAAILLTNPNHPFYAKVHLVPYGEYIPLRSLIGGIYSLFNLPMVGFTEGSINQSPIVVDNQKLAFNICYENGFNSELINLARQSTIMVNLSDMIWYGKTIAKDEHLQISQARALENQRPFIQATNSGMTAVIDPYGRIQSQLPYFHRDILYDLVQGRVGMTIFQRFGNYPVMLLCVIVFIITYFLHKIKTSRVR